MEISETELKEHADLLGMSSEDYYFHTRVKREEEEEMDEGVSSEVRIPFLGKSKKQHRQKKAVHGMMFNELAQSTDPFLDFLATLGAAAVMDITQPATYGQESKMAKYTFASKRRDVIFSINITGGPMWKFRQGIAHLSGVTPTAIIPGTYTPPPGTTLLHYAFPSQGALPLAEFFDDEKKMKKGNATSNLFGKQQLSSQMAARPFRIMATGLESDALTLVLPEEAKTRAAMSGVVFPLRGRRDPSVLVDSSDIRSSGGAFFLVFDVATLRSVYVLTLGQEFWPRAGPVTRITHSSQSLTLASGDGKDAKMSHLIATEEYISELIMGDRMVRMRANEKIFRGITEAIGEETLLKWQHGVVAVMGHTLATLRHNNAIEHSTIRGRLTERAIDLSLLSETVRSGLLHMIANQSADRVTITPEMAGTMASVLWQLALMLRWTIFGLLQSDVYARERGQWKKRRGLVTLSIGNVANFVSELFVLDFAKLVKKKQSQPRVSEFIEALRDYHHEILDAAPRIHNSANPYKGGASAMAMLMRNYIITHISMHYERDRLEWPNQLEGLVFVLLASGAAMAKQAGLDAEGIHTIVGMITSADVIPRTIIDVHNAIVERAIAAMTKKQTPSPVDVTPSAASLRDD